MGVTRHIDSVRSIFIEVHGANGVVARFPMSKIPDIIEQLRVAISEEDIALELNEKQSVPPVGEVHLV